MKKYQINLTFESLPADHLTFIDNSIATATMVLMSLRDKMDGMELRKNEGKSSILVTGIEGTPVETKVIIFLHDYSDDEDYLNLFKWIIRKYSDDYPIKMEILEVYEEK